MRREGNSKVTVRSAGRPADGEYGGGIHFFLEPTCAFAFSNLWGWNSKVYLMGRKVRWGRPQLDLRSARLRILLDRAQEGAGANDPSLLRAAPVSRRALASRRPVAAANASFRHSRWACSCGLRCPSQEYPAMGSPKGLRPTLVPRARTTSACRRQRSRNMLPRGGVRREWRRSTTNRQGCHCRGFRYRRQCQGGVAAADTVARPCLRTRIEARP